MNYTSSNLTFKYQMLSRLISDCEYYINSYNWFFKPYSPNEKHLYYKNVKKHIEEMIKLYNSFSDEAKPEWTSLKHIENLKNQMLNIEEEVKHYLGDKNAL